MKTKKSIILIMSVTTLLLSLTLTSCAKKNTTELPTKTKTETNAEEVQKTPETKVEPVIETEKNIELIEIEVPVEIEKLDISKFGYEIKDDNLYFNDKVLSSNSLINYNIEIDEAKFNYSDGSSLMLDENGNLSAEFPVGIAINVDKDFTDFNILYNDFIITKAPIMNFSSLEDWYTMDFGNNTFIKFNSNTIEAHSDNLTISIDEDTNLTKIDDLIISASPITNFSIDGALITIDYADETTIKHIINGSTTYLFASGSEIISDFDKTSFIINDTTTILPGKLTSIVFDEETETFEFATSTENFKFKNISDPELVENIALSTTLPEEEEVKEIAAVEDSKTEEISLENIIPATNDENSDVWEEDITFETYKPYRIGLSGNLSKFFTEDTSSTFGLKLDLVLERKVSENFVIGMFIGFGADKFDDGFYKEATTMLTLSQEFPIEASKDLSFFYTVGIGSLIPIMEDESMAFLRAKAGVGLNYMIADSWQVRTGFNYNFNYRKDDIRHSIEIPVSLLYCF